MKVGSNLTLPTYGPLTGYSARTIQDVTRGGLELDNDDYVVPTRTVLGQPLIQPVHIDRVEEIAAEKLGKTNFSYQKGKTGLGASYESNISSFLKYEFVGPSLLSEARHMGIQDMSVKMIFRGVPSNSTQSGRREVTSPTPFVMTSLALHSIYNSPLAEKASAKASNEAGFTFFLSQLAQYSVEAVNDFMSDTTPANVVAGTAGGGWKVPRMYQLYNSFDVDELDEQMQRAVDSGYCAVINTVDATLGFQSLPIPNWSYLGNTGTHNAGFIGQPDATDGGFNVAVQGFVLPGQGGAFASSRQINRWLAKNVGKVIATKYLVPGSLQDPTINEATLVYDSNLLVPAVLPNVGSNTLTLHNKSYDFYAKILRYGNNNNIALGSKKRGVAGTPGAFSAYTSDWFDEDKWYDYMVTRKKKDPHTIKAYAKRAHCKGLGYFVKGIQTKEELLGCFFSGADGVVISNHGGRYIHSGRSTMDIMWEWKELIADIKKGKYDSQAIHGNGKNFLIIVDSGIRTPADAAMLLAIGADMVSLGRPAIMGLTVGGIPGMYDVFHQFVNQVAYQITWFGKETAKDFTGCSVKENIIRRKI